MMLKKNLIVKPIVKPGEETVAKHDRYIICEIGRLFWGDRKQCYSADAVFRKVKESLSQNIHDIGCDTCLRLDEKTRRCDVSEECLGGISPPVYVGKKRCSEYSYTYWEPKRKI